MAWQWEGDWSLELTLDGQPLDHDGWTYAVDFPAQYYPKKQWKSYVRRRLWVRSRKYSAMNSWCAIAPLHKDATNVSTYHYFQLYVNQIRTALECNRINSSKYCVNHTDLSVFISRYSSYIMEIFVTLVVFVPQTTLYFPVVNSQCPQYFR